MKTYSNIILYLTLLFGVLTVLTDKQGLNSLSATHGKVNEAFYFLMHGFAIIWLTWNKKVKSNKWLALGMLGILSFSMYRHYWIHSIATIGTMCAVFLSIGLESLKTKFNKIMILGSTITALGLFAIGYFNTTFHFAIAELLVLGIGLFLKQYEINNLK